MSANYKGKKMLWDYYNYYYISSEVSFFRALMSIQAIKFNKVVQAVKYLIYEMCLSADDRARLTLDNDSFLLILILGSQTI